MGRPRHENPSPEALRMRRRRERARLATHMGVLIDGRTGDPVGPEDEVERGMVAMLAADNRRMRDAGCKLAEAALYSVREYDGLHRLSLAVAEWAKAVADEGGRGGARKE